jgi:hypothetical protein
MAQRGPPQLGADDVVRFLEGAHFLEEHADTLSRGRLFARTRRTFEVGAKLRIAIEVPEVDRTVVSDARVLLSKPGYVGLELIGFEPRVRTLLDRAKIAVEDARAAVDVPTAEQTQIASLAELGIPVGGSAPPTAPPSPPPSARAPASAEDEALPPIAAPREPESSAEARARVRPPPRPIPRPAPARRPHADDDERSSPPEDEVSFELVRAAQDATLAMPALRRPAAEPRRRPAAPVASARDDEARRRPAADPKPPTARPASAADTDDALVLVRAPSEPAPAPLRAARASEPPRALDGRGAAPPATTGAPPAEDRLAALLDEVRPGGHALGARARGVDAPSSAPPPSTRDLLVVAPNLEDLDTGGAPAADPALAPPVALALPDRAAASEPAVAELPPPAIAAWGLDRLADAGAPRCTPGGVVRVASVEALLGLYLAGLRDGHVTLLGGPDGEADAEVRLKLIAGRAVMLDARVLARVGDWVTVHVADVRELTELLAERAEALWPALTTLLGPPPGAATTSIAPAITPEPPPTSAPAAPPPVSAPQPRMSLAAEPFVEPTPAPATTSPAPPEPPRWIEPDAAGPPEAGRLDGDHLIFRSLRDLAHELDTNVERGGLSAAAAPLPIRAHKSLSVVLGEHVTSVVLEVDVVFAGGGRVGFALRRAPEVTAQLRRLVSELRGNGTSALLAARGAGAWSGAAPTSAPPGAAAASSGGISAPPQPMPASPSVPVSPTALEPGGLAPASGKLVRPPNPQALLSQPEHRLEALEDLEDEPVSVFALLDLLARRRARGVLAIRGDTVERTIYLHEGSVVFVDGRPAVDEHLLGRILVGAKKLTEGALREALEKAQRARKPLGRVLVLGGVVPQPVIVQALREQTRLKVEAALGIAQGTWEWRAWSEPPTTADLVAVGGPGLVTRYVRHVLDHVTATDLETLFAPLQGRVVELGGELPVDSPLLGLQPKELRFVEGWIDGKRTISDALTGSPVGRLASLRLIAFGLAVGLMRIRGGLGGVRRAPGRGSTDGRGLAALRKQLAEDVRQLREQSYFEVLGVHWSAHPRSFQGAYLKVKARFDPAKLEVVGAPPDVQAELQRLAREALELVDTAYKKLTVEAERTSYRKELLDSTEREYGAEMLIKQGEVMLLRGDRIGGLEAFEMACELSPTSKNKALLAAARDGRA